MAARDGGICRIKLPGGILHAAQAHAIADAAERYAAGLIELTNRANLQVRGVRVGQEAALIEVLVKAGLGPDGLVADDLPDALRDALPEVSPDALAEATSKAALAAAAADDVRNLMLSPTAGCDPSALFDTTALAADILMRLQIEPRFAALSPKFAVLLDGGERLAMLDHPHDVWLAALDHPDGVRFALGLAGCPPVAQRDEPLPLPATADETAQSHDAPTSWQNTCALATVLPSQVLTLISALLHTFLDLAAPEHTRMRHLLATHSTEDILQHAQRYLDFPLALLRSNGASLTAWRRAKADPALRFGAHRQRVAGMWYVGGQPPLGRLDATTLHALAALAEAAGGATLRATPWQSVLLPDIATHAVPSTLARLSELGLLCEPTHPLARLIACAGSSGCAKGMADTKADALLLAAQLPPQLPAQVEQVHLSGCPRSCAAAHRAAYTLLAVAPGRYDLYRRDDNEPGFGQCVAHHLTIDQAAHQLERLARSPLDA